MIDNKDKTFDFDQENYNEIDLISIFHTLVRKKSTIFVTTFLGTLFGIIYSLIQPSIYRGKFQVVIDSKKEENTSVRLTAVQNLLPGSMSSIKTEELILKSPFVLKPVYEYAVSEYALRNDNKQYWSFSRWSSKVLSINSKLGTNILELSFNDRDPVFILNTLEKIISEYQDYSKLSRDKNLKKSLNFLSKQQVILKEKAVNSLKELNQFSIDNGLGDIDGFVSLGTSENDKNLNNEKFNSKTNQTSSEGRSEAGQRFDNQFALLEQYEADYVDYSAILKPNSELLKKLKLRIENLKEALKRPNEILLRFKELSRVAARDESMLIEIEDNLAFTKLEISRQKDPWDIIFEPTIDDYRVSPQRTKTTIQAFFVSLLIGSLLAYVKEKLSGQIFELNELKDLINCKFIDSIELTNKEISKKIIYKFMEDKTQENLENALRKTYFINTFSDYDNETKNFANSIFKNERILIITLKDLNLIEKAEFLIILINKNNIHKKEINLINRYITLFPSKILGWFFLEGK